MTKTQQDITIIGAGPTGLFAAFYAGQRGLKTTIIDALPEAGGQLTALYPEKTIYDVAGFPEVSAKSLVKQLVNQTDYFKPTYALGVQATYLNHNSTGFSITGDDGETYRSSTVLIAAGIGAFEPRRLPAENVAAFEGRGISYRVQEMAYYANKHLLIIGGGDSAVDWFVMLKDVAASITLIHWMDTFQAHVSTVEQMMNACAAAPERLKVLTKTELVAVHGHNHVQRATLRHKDSGEEHEIVISELLSMIGFVSSLGTLAEWGLEGNKSSVLVRPDMRTNIPGIYACGDIAAYEGKVKLIATGFAEAATATNHIAHYINPKARVKPGYSSAKKRPAQPAQQVAVVS